ncbi:MAG: LysM peptidoglycan-binding domain-containing protein [Pontiellaceae bacterium]|nr:LysM peptidoglycan-binding domain-containing protein [Pontiellaceae bacterium]MBN2784176.1 LysM peptidoglycan-binding domain-containing protein [Pontiellaceae bacterium]
MNTIRSIYTIGILICAGLLCVHPLRAEEVVVPVQAPETSLEELKKLAGESQFYRSQYLSLRKLLDDMLALLPSEMQEGKDVRGKVGQLSELLNKASKSDALEREVKELWKEFDAVRLQIRHLEEELAETRAERDKVLEQLDAFKAKADKWDSVTAGLRETIERLLLGEYEYYEVKDGDTLQSIAANPMVYGDVSRAAWLRQVNEGLVSHLDSLRPGEVLVIPRFPRDGAYEF